MSHTHDSRSANIHSRRSTANTLTRDSMTPRQHPSHHRHSHELSRPRRDESATSHRSSSSTSALGLAVSFFASSRNVVDYMRSRHLLDEQVSEIESELDYCLPPKLRRDLRAYPETRHTACTLSNVQSPHCDRMQTLAEARSFLEERKGTTRRQVDAVDALIDNHSSAFTDDWSRKSEYLWDKMMTRYPPSRMPSRIFTGAHMLYQQGKKAGKNLSDWIG